MPPLRVALLGTRGIPARYGGFETYVEEVGARLAARGHEVTVYCRAGGEVAPPVYRGVRRVVLPSVRTKHLDTLSHTAASVLHLLPRGADVVHVCNVGNAPVLPLLRARGLPTVLSLDALEWKRRKWDGAARAFLQSAERLAVRFADVLVADSRVVAAYYRERHGRVPVYVPYGAPLLDAVGTDRLAALGLEPGRYVLFVGRLVPEKGAHLLVEAFARVRTDHALAVVGDDPFERAYVAALRGRAGPRVRFLGYVFGEAALQLFAHAALYVQPSEVDGTSPALLTAMGLGRCVVVNSIPEHLETVGEAGVAFRLNDVEDLARVLGRLLAEPQTAAALGERARARVRRHFTWEGVTAALEALYVWLAGRRTRPGTAA